MSNAKVMPLLKGTRLLADLPDVVLAEIADRVRHERYRTGDVIFAKHQTGTPVYCVVEGRVRIVTAGRNGNSLHLAMIEPGELFGELTLVDDQPRGVTAISDGKISILKLNRDLLRSVLDTHPSCARA